MAAVDPIPKEILESEQRNQAGASSSQPETPRLELPGIIGLPPLPSDLVTIAVKYGPWLVLAAAVMNVFDLLGYATVPQSPLDQVPAGFAPSLILKIAATLLMILGFFWLQERRRIGWNAVAIALLLQFAGQLILGGVTSLLFTGMELIITAYVMLQVRDSYDR